MDKTKKMAVSIDYISLGGNFGKNFGKVGARPEKRIFFARLDFWKLPVANTLANSEGNTSGNTIAKYNKIYVAQKRLKNKVFY